MGIHARLAYLALPVIILDSALNTLAYGTPVALDLATGPQSPLGQPQGTHGVTFTRPPCRQLHQIIHHFTMTTDGTTHQTNVRRILPGSQHH